MWTGSWQRSRGNCAARVLGCRLIALRACPSEATAVQKRLRVLQRGSRSASYATRESRMRRKHSCCPKREATPKATPGGVIEGSRLAAPEALPPEHRANSKHPGRGARTSKKTALKGPLSEARYSSQIGADRGSSRTPPGCYFAATVTGGSASGAATGYPHSPFQGDLFWTGLVGHLLIDVGRSGRKSISRFL